MRKFDGFEPKAQTNVLPPIPAGVYIAQIIGAKVEETQYGERLLVQVEVAEGEYKGYFKRQFESKQGGNFEAKYAGVLRLNVPTGDGSERDGWNVNAFNGAMWCVEQSNSGYKWNWDERTLKGKMVGINVREREYEFNGVDGITTEICRFEEVQRVRDGKAKVAKRRELKHPASTAPAYVAPAGFVETTDEDEELPF